MIRINLLPYREAAKKENIKRQIFITVGTFVILVLILVYGKISLSLSVNSLEEKVKVKEAQLVVLAKKLGDIEGLKKSIKELEQKLSVINGLEENRHFPVRMLEEMAQLVPEKDVWLEKLDVTGNDVKIEGVGRNNVAIARYMKNLELSKIVSSVTLITTQEREISGYKLQEFSLSCVLKKG